MHPRLFALVIGGTSRARKGSSLAMVSPVLEQAATAAGLDFQSMCETGLSSGEGLISKIQEVVDGRVLVTEEEFGKTLAVMNRDGNALSGVLRTAYDGRPLAVLTKEPISADENHVNLIGHVTAHELNAMLRSNDVHNGLANRMLMIYSERHQLVPIAVRPPAAKVSALAKELGASLRTARGIGEIGYDAAFENAWHLAYERIETAPARSIVLEALTARATTHVWMLSFLYALLDGVREMTVDHLNAAVALWSYAEETAQYVFGTADPRVQKIIAASIDAGDEGLSRTDVQTLLGNNLTGKALDDLWAAALATEKVQQATIATRGRPKQVLRPVVEAEQQDAS